MTKYIKSRLTVTITLIDNGNLNIEPRHVRMVDVGLPALSRRQSACEIQEIRCSSETSIAATRNQDADGVGSLWKK